MYPELCFLKFLMMSQMRNFSLDFSVRFSELQIIQLYIYWVIFALIILHFVLFYDLFCKADQLSLLLMTQLDTFFSFTVYSFLCHKMKKNILVFINVQTTNCYLIYKPGLYYTCTNYHIASELELYIQEIWVDRPQSSNSIHTKHCKFIANKKFHIVLDL